MLPKVKLALYPFLCSLSPKAMHNSNCGRNCTQVLYLSTPKLLASAMTAGTVRPTPITHKTASIIII